MVGSPVRRDQLTAGPVVPVAAYVVPMRAGRVPLREVAPADRVPLAGVERNRRVSARRALTAPR